LSLFAAKHLGICVTLAIALSASLVPAAWGEPTSAQIDPSRAKLAASISQLLEDAIPVNYDKRKDWGAQTEMVVGLRTEGSGFHTKIHRRKKMVDHGVWKHYRLRVIEPEQNLSVQLTRLEPIAPGRIGFTLRVDAKLDAWARAKVYQYGVHIIALEIEGDTRMILDLSGEIALQVTAVDGSPGMTVDPRVTDARLQLEEFHIRRVSQARGPIVKELSGGVRRVIEEEANGPQLVEKLNRAIDKKRDRLVFSTADWLTSGWFQASQLPMPQASLQK
jgi:hypothetical protein